MKNYYASKKCYTEGFAGIKSGSSGVSYGNDVAMLEGFARILWGLAPLWGGKQKKLKNVKNIKCKCYKKQREIKKVDIKKGWKFGASRVPGNTPF